MDKRNTHLAFAKTQRGFDGFREPRFVRGIKRDPVLHDLHNGGQFSFCEAHRIIGADDITEDKNAGVTLRLEEWKKIFSACFCRNGHAEEDERCLARVFT